MMITVTLLRSVTRALMLAHSYKLQCSFIVWAVIAFAANRLYQSQLVRAVDTRVRPVVPHMGDVYTAFSSSTTNGLHAQLSQSVNLRVRPGVMLYMHSTVLLLFPVEEENQTFDHPNYLLVQFQSIVKFRELTRMFLSSLCAFGNHFWFGFPRKRLLKITLFTFTNIIHVIQHDVFEGGDHDCSHSNTLPRLLDWG